MPEHLDDFDLDRAFADLLEDVGGRTTPPSASAIIERARRRRTTTFAAAAAVVLIVGAGAVASGVGRPTAAPGPSGQLPAPHLLDRDAWAAATDGWIDEWQVAPDPGSPSWVNDLQGPACVFMLGDPGTLPDRRGMFTLVSDRHVFAEGVMSEYDDPTPAQSNWRQLKDAMGSCGDATLVREMTWDGASAQSYALKSKDGRQHLWIAHEGPALGIVWVAGNGSPLPAETDSRIMAAIAAGLQDPDSFTEQDDTGSSASGSAGSGATVTENDFAQALGSWDSDWERRGGKSADGSMPCLSVDSNSAYSGGSGGSLGTNGYFSASSFSYEAAAATALEGTMSQLESCTSVAWTVDTVGSQQQVLVASSDTGVAWIVRMGSSIGVIAIRGGHADPPVQVSAAVGAVIDRALRMTNP